MAGHSHVRKRRRGCLGGCLTRLLLLLGLLALLFVGACVLGFVRNDPDTGRPSLTLENIDLGSVDLPDLSRISLPDLEKIQLAEGGFSGAAEMVKKNLGTWPYAVSQEGLTVKTLRAGKGEAVLVCADGYTMLLGGGSGMGAMLTGQLWLSGVGHLNAVVAMNSDAAQIGGLPLAMTLMQPDYLLYPAAQTKGAAYNRLIKTAEKSSKTKLMSVKQGTAFMLGRAQVTIIGPVKTPHVDERNDGLSVRIDYGQTSVLVLGGIAASGERELITSRVNLNADALICAQGGGEEATCQELVAAVTPSIALLTGKNPSNAVRVRLMRVDAQVCCQKDYGVMTLYSDGQTMTVRP